MTNNHSELLKAFLKNKALSTTGSPHANILFYDNIDHKRVELSVWWEVSDDNFYISGDESQIYTFDELDLIDESILNPSTTHTSIPDSINTPSILDFNNLQQGLEALHELVSFCRFNHKESNQSTITHDHTIYKSIEHCYNHAPLAMFLNMNGIFILSLNNTFILSYNSGTTGS